MGIFKLIILSISLIFALGSSWARPLVVVSDLDDTLKITQVQSSGRAVWNGVFTRKVFAGIPLLWDTLVHATTASYVLTSSPNQLRFNIEKLFMKFDMQVDELITRNIFRQRDSFKYKYQAIKEILKNHPRAGVVLMGDNTDKDHEVYQQIHDEYPNRVVAIYMHRVKKLNIPSGQTPWITTFDIAYNEFLANRMSYSEVVSIYESVINANMKSIIPTKLFCPTSETDWSTVEESEKYKALELEGMQKKIILKILKYCRSLTKA
jgi:hypothetical protein